MRLNLLMLVLLLLSPLAQAQEVRINTQLLPDTGIRAGQTLHYQIDVMTDTWLTGTPEFSSLEIPGTLVSFEGSHGRPIQRTLDSKRYFGIRYRYRLVPLQAGVISIPAQLIRVPIGQVKEPVTASTPGLSLAVQALPALKTGQLSLLAGDVQLSQTLIPASASIEQGQAVIREIRVEALDALPLSIPSVSSPSNGPIQGTHLPPEISALKDSGGNTTGGLRVESVRYLLEQTGSHELPPVELSWWDIDENKVKHARLPAMTIEVVPAAITPPLLTRLHQIVSDRGQELGKQSLVVLLLLGFGIGAALYYHRRLLRIFRSSLEALQSRWQASRIRARLLARQQLRQYPPELSAVYQLVRRESGGVSVRHSDLMQGTRHKLLDGLNLLYSPTPEPRQAHRLLTRALRKLGRRSENRRFESSRQKLPTLNPEAAPHVTKDSGSTEPF